MFWWIFVLNLLRYKIKLISKDTMLVVYQFLLETKCFFIYFLNFLENFNQNIFFYGKNNLKTLTFSFSSFIRWLFSVACWLLLRLVELGPGEWYTDLSLKKCTNKLRNQIKPLLLHLYLTHDCRLALSLGQRRILRALFTMLPLRGPIVTHHSH